MFFDSFLMSLRSLSRRRLRSWLTIIGVIIGIAAVVSLISLGEGLNTVILSQFSLVGSDVLGVMAKGTGNGPPGTGVIEPLTISDMNSINRISDVEFTIGRVVRGGKAEFNDVLQFGYAGSVPNGEGTEQLYKLLNLEAEKGRLIKSGDTKKIAIGHDLAQKDTFGKEIFVGSTILVNDEEFEVVGIIKKKGSFIIDGSILMLEDEMRINFDIDDEVLDAISIKAKNGVNVNSLKQNVEKVLRKERDVKLGEENFDVETNESALKNLQSTLFAVQIFVYIIAGISIVVGGIGIMNTMYTSVLERTNEVGIMKAIGAKNKDIFALFFIESGLIGIVGGVIGVILGVSMALGLTSFGRIILETDLISAQISPELIIGALLFSFIIGTISGLLPAYQASKMNIVDALRE
jgi:putative ABC transport system permease protein